MVKVLTGSPSIDDFLGLSVKRFVDLSVEETADLWLTAQKVGSQLEKYHGASSLTLAIQTQRTNPENGTAGNTAIINLSPDSSQSKRSVNTPLNSPQSPMQFADMKDKRNGSVSLGKGTIGMHDSTPLSTPREVRTNIKMHNYSLVGLIEHKVKEANVDKEIPPRPKAPFRFTNSWTLHPGFMEVVKKDGPQAGQTVPHIHIHILPRKGGDFEKNDEIYDALDVKEKELKETLDLDKERKDRSMEEMAQEAEEYRKLFL
ncbi:hypothetical protein GIB67_042005 [Kingdonia uniflora]|uniref:HIT domain-containing protein n=1 Tax=Kingdonia uniflora TaxID=39325 RepID=A0A7J7P0C4_9MAGN|nr:hypothetical protein GIB67_042005 [Kingdonia uniflora]